MLKAAPHRSEVPSTSSGVRTRRGRSPGRDRSPGRGPLALGGILAWALFFPAAPAAPTGWALQADATPTNPAAALANPTPDPTPPDTVTAENPAPRPWLSPEVRWHPAVPAEGTALALFVRPPEGARAPEGVEATLDGRPVPLLRTEAGWFGVGALPVETTGPRALELLYRLGPDSTLREVRTVEVAAREFPSRQLRVAPRYTEPPPEVLERIRGERARIRAALAGGGPAWLVGEAFTWPRPPRFTSGFGERRMFNERVQSRHLGLDLAGTEGAPVLAPAAGRVVLTGDFYYQGKAVYVEHGLGLYTGYFHLSRIDVAEGDEVRRGQLLGAVGATGRVTGPHLHWSAYVAGENVDPASLLELELPRGGASSPAAEAR